MDSVSREFREKVCEKCGLVFADSIVDFVLKFLQDPELNYSNWAEAWLFGLLLDAHTQAKIDVEYVRKRAFDKNLNQVTRALCLLLLSKILAPEEMVHFFDIYQEERSPVIRRALLICMSKLPQTASGSYLEIAAEDELDIKVLKSYLKTHKYPQESRVV